MKQRPNGQVKPPTPLSTEEIEFWERLKMYRSEEDLNTLIERFHPMVCDLARKIYQSNGKRAETGLELDDLISVAWYHILAHCVSRYNPLMGYQFSTFIYRGLKQRMQREVEGCRVINLPPDVTLVSGDETVADYGDDFTRFDIVAGEEPTVEEQVIDREIARDLQSLRDGLSHRENAVMQMRYFEGVTLQEVADRIGLSRNGVYNIQNRAIEKIRTSAEGSPLESMVLEK